MIQRTFENPSQTVQTPAWRQVETRKLFSAEHLLPRVHEQLLDLALVRIALFPAESVHESHSLMNEAFTRVSLTRRRFDGSSQLFFAVAQAMNEVEHEEKTRHRGLARGGMLHRITDEALKEQPGPGDRSEVIMMVDEAVMKLKRNDPTNARVVVLRYFNGLTAEETAKVLNVSLATVERKWRRLKTWLHKELV